MPYDIYGNWHFSHDARVAKEEEIRLRLAGREKEAQRWQKEHNRLYEERLRQARLERDQRERARREKERADRLRREAQERQRTLDTDNNFIESQLQRILDQLLASANQTNATPSIPNPFNSAPKPQPVIKEKPKPTIEPLGPRVIDLGE